MKLSEKAQASLQQVITQFQAGDLSPIVTVARIRRHPDDVRPFDTWSFSNRVLAFIQTGSCDCRGYRQWQAAGRQVKKGERAAHILAPRFRKVASEDEDEARQILTGFLSVAVFADHQTEGEPLPVFDYAPAELPPLAEVAAALGIPVTYVPLAPDRLGQYAPHQDAIALGTHDPETFFHELAHAIHYRINPQVQPGRDKAGKETVAEFTATVLMHLYGLGNVQNAFGVLPGKNHEAVFVRNCWTYIAHFAPDPLVAITKALAEVAQVLAFLDMQRPGDARNIAGSEVAVVPSTKKGAPL